MPPNDALWFEVIEGVELLQGDVLFDCPVANVVNALPKPLVADFTPEIEIRDYDLIVVTQSCDLANDKVEDVLLARVVAWTDHVRSGASANPVLRSRDFRRGLIAGNVPGLSLLRKNDGTPFLPWSVVDFHRIFSIPKLFLRQWIDPHQPRLRLVSPYREHLAQAFARFFMRVGLPDDAKAFEAEGKVD